MRTGLRFAATSGLLVFACTRSQPASTSQDAGDDGAVSVDAGDDASADADAGAPDDAAIAGYDGMTTAHGTIVDYFTLNGIPNLTITGQGQSATTDDAGAFSFVVNGDQPLMPQVTGPSFCDLIFPEVIPAQADLDYGPSVMASSSTFSIETSGLSADLSKGLVQIVVRTDASCASAAGGTLTVVSPPGTSVAYFNTLGLPDNTVTSFQNVQVPRPVAVVFNVEPGAELVLRVDHPTCTQVPFPYERDGRTYTGRVDIRAIDPGSFNSALVLQLR